MIKTAGFMQVDGYTGYNGLLDPQRPGGPVTFAFAAVALWRRKGSVQAHGL
jgi:hypothetical protein